MWLIYALLSAMFAASTSLLAKAGIDGVNSHLATAIRTAVEEERPPVLVNKTKGVEIPLATVFTDRQKKMILAGGLLNATKNAK